MAAAAPVVQPIVVGPLRPLLPHQEAGAVAIAAKLHAGATGVALCDPPRSGKTLTALRAAKLFLGERGMCLVLCPVTLMEYWVQEIERSLGVKPTKYYRADRHIPDGAGPRFVVSTMHTLLHDIIGGKMPPMLQCEFSLVIVDEAHRYAASDGKLIQSLRCLRAPRLLFVSSNLVSSSTPFSPLWLFKHLRIQPPTCEGMAASTTNQLPALRWTPRPGDRQFPPLGRDFSKLPKSLQKQCVAKQIRELTAIKDHFEPGGLLAVAGLVDNVTSSCKRLNLQIWPEALVVCMLQNTRQWKQFLYWMDQDIIWDAFHQSITLDGLADAPLLRSFRDAVCVYHRVDQMLFPQVPVKPVIVTELVPVRRNAPLQQAMQALVEALPNGPFSGQEARPVGPHLIAKLNCVRQLSVAPEIFSRGAVAGLTPIIQRVLQKVEQLELHVPDAAVGEKLVIFTDWLEVIDQLQVLLEHRGVTVCTLSSRVGVDDYCPSTERMKQLEKFESAKSAVLLASTRLGSMGIDLSCARHAIFLAPSWNPTIQQQCIVRCTGLGHSLPISVLSLVPSWQHFRGAVDRHEIPMLQSRLHELDVLATPLSIDELMVAKCSYQRACIGEFGDDWGANEVEEDDDDDAVPLDAVESDTAQLRSVLDFLCLRKDSFMTIAHSLELD